jgi:hypothetical protein
MPCLGNFQRQEKDAQEVDPELLEENVTRILMAHLVYQCMHGLHESQICSGFSTVYGYVKDTN